MHKGATTHLFLLQAHGRTHSFMSACTDYTMWYYKVYVCLLTGRTTGSSIVLSTGSAVAITAVLCSVVFFLLGAVCGMLIHYCLSSTAKRRAQYSVSSSSTEPQTPAPVLEEISATDTKPKAIELSDNIAYGPV